MCESLIEILINEKFGHFKTEELLGGEGRIFLSALSQVAQKACSQYETLLSLLDCINVGLQIPSYDTYLLTVLARLLL